MTEYLVAGLVLLGGTVTTIFGELVNEEIRGWLDYLPRASVGSALPLTPGARAPLVVVALMTFVPGRSGTVARKCPSALAATT